MKVTKTGNIAKEEPGGGSGGSRTPRWGYIYGEALEGREKAVQRLREAEREIRQLREDAIAAYDRARRVEADMDRLESELRRITPPGSAASLLLAQYGRSTASAAACTGDVVVRELSPREVLAREVEEFHARRGVRARGL